MELFFGGSFDPIHVGHLIVARDALEALGFERLVFVPAYQAPLKEPHIASPEDRLTMVKLAIENLQGFEVSDIEIKRGGISYTVYTVRELYERLGRKPFFLVGADSFLNFHLWKDSRDILRLANLVIVDREEKSKRVMEYIKENFPNLKEGKDFILLPIRRIDISSTEIRERLRRGKGIRWMVPEAVEGYILERGLYR